MEPCYADRAWCGSVMVVENVQLARDTYRVRFEAPEIAQRIVPGQFLMLRLAGWNDPLLGRPLALYDTVLNGAGQPTGLDVVYLVTGKMTRRLAAFQPGQTLDVWGPLGNGFAPARGGTLLMVAGGIGQTPFMALGREALGLRSYGVGGRETQRAERVVLCYGARSAPYLAGLDEFRALGLELRTSTDDGTAGHHGRVTDLLNQALDEQPANPRIVCCGPEVMMHAVAKIAAQRHVPCQVSLETPMACGIGICFTCVAKVRDEGASAEWDYRRTCVEGPVFDSHRIVFD
ncbi:MAG: dihydroorotate dehydrogenase electron transfer subunit [Planctomycetes bacterium]|nr:dihydroorotate dehydrogenase electron transfer subunit [Planctomycetota bacterium]